VVTRKSKGIKKEGEEDENHHIQLLSLLLAVRVEEERAFLKLPSGGDNVEQLTNGSSELKIDVAKRKGTEKFDSSKGRDKERKRSRGGKRRTSF